MRYHGIVDGDCTFVLALGSGQNHSLVVVFVFLFLILVVLFKYFYIGMSEQNFYIVQISNILKPKRESQFPLFADFEQRLPGTFLAPLSLEVTQGPLEVDQATLLHV